MHQIIFAAGCILFLLSLRSVNKLVKYKDIFNVFLSVIQLQAIMAFSLSELLKYGYFNFFTHKQTLLIMLIGLFALQFAASQVTYRFGEDSEVLRTVDGRIRGARDRKGKDFVFGGLFPIHSDVAGSGGAQCGEVRRERGLERMEAMLFAVDHINSDPNILSGIELGYDVRDTCNSENIGLDETIDLIITGSQLDIQSCQSDDSIGVNGTDPSLTFKPPTSGIIGAAASRVSVPIASLVRLFQVPQVSYASSSAILSNRDRYEYFYRTIPPDNQQARAMIDVLLKFRWTYVSTIYSRNPYGEPGIVEFRLLAAQNGICIDLDEGIEDSFGDTEFDNLATSLIGSAANVVIVFASQDNAQKLLSRISITPSAKRFTWIASDAWARSINVVHQFNETAAGLYGFAPLTEHVSQFQDYFSNLTIDSNNRNPWFPEFYSAFVGCSLDSNATVPCATNQSVTELSQYAQGNFIPLVVDAVYTYAHALDNFLNDSCQLPIRWDRVNRTCVGQTQALTGSILLDYISQVDFVNPLTGDRVVFDKEGNVEGRYEILNYQAMDSEDGSAREYFFTTVGVWDGSALNDSSVEALTLLNSTQFQFGISNVTNIIRTEPQISQCGTCKLGQFRRIVQSSCCGICEDCLGQSFSNDSQGLACLECESEFWGNNPLEGSDSCVPITETFIRHSDAFSVIVICLAILGLIVVIATSIVYFIFWKTPVVKSSGREQMITLLIGIGLSFILAFVYVSPPVPGVCAVQRVGFWFCYSLMFGALLIKIVRVTRIFYNQKGVTRVRFTEPYFQIIFTFFIVLGQVIILIVGLIVVYPEVVRNLRTNRENQDDFPEIVVSCVNEHIAILILCAVYETLLIVLSTILGVLSFKYPENFNEAKFVSFCTFIIAIVWAAFVGLYAYFAVEERQEIQNAITGLATVLSAFAVLACLFGPKLFIIIFRPSQNTDDYSRSKVGNEFHSSIDIPLGSLVGQRSSMHFGTSGVTASTNIDGSVVRDDYKTRGEWYG